MDRSAFIFALKARVVGQPQKETLIGLTMNKIFDGINELARIGINLEVHEDLALEGEEYPAWATNGDATQERLVNSLDELNALGDGWAIKQHVPPSEDVAGGNPNALFSSGGAVSERRIPDVEHATGTVAPRGGVDAVSRTDIDEHPIVSLHSTYAAPAPAMTGAQMINQSQATQRAQSGTPTPPPLNSPENGNVERVDQTEVDGGEHHDEGEHKDSDPPVDVAPPPGEFPNDIPPPDTAHSSDDVPPGHNE